jgi:hypothetical protein
MVWVRNMSNVIGLTQPKKKHEVKILNIAVGHKADYSELQALMESEYELTDVITTGGTEGYHGSYTIFILQKWG